MSQFFTLGGQSIGISASASVLPINIQDWFPLGCTGWISLQSKELSWVQRHSSKFAQAHIHWVSDIIQPLILYPLFSSCLQSFLASRSFQMSWHFTSGGQNIGDSALVLPMKIQGWFPLGWTELISLLSAFPEHRQWKSAGIENRNEDWEGITAPHVMLSLIFLISSILYTSFNNEGS